MRVIDRLVEFRYIAQQDRELPQEEQTVWVLRGLPYDVQQDLDAKVSPMINLPGSSVGQDSDGLRRSLESASVSVNVSGGRAELQFDVLKAGIIGVENLKDIHGNEVRYPGSASPALTLKQWFARWIPSDVRTEIANEIIVCSTLTEADAKN